MLFKLASCTHHFCRKGFLNWTTWGKELSPLAYSDLSNSLPVSIFVHTSAISFLRWTDTKCFQYSRCRCCMNLYKWMSNSEKSVGTWQKASLVIMMLPLMFPLIFLNWIILLTSVIYCRNKFHKWAQQCGNADPLLLLAEIQNKEDSYCHSRPWIINSVSP